MPENEDFNLEEFDRQWEAEQAELDGQEESEDQAVDDVEYEDSDDDGVQEEEHDTEDTEAEPDASGDDVPNLADDDKRNAAFAQLRRERDEAAKQAAFLQRLADENGLTVEEIVQRYEEARLEEEAIEQDVPVEVLQRLKQLESENDDIKRQNFSERFNRDVENTIQKYAASNEEVEQTFQYAHENGLTDMLKNGSTTFEAVHKLAHMDSMIESQVQKALQDNLTKKKKRQQDAPLQHGSGADFTADSLEDRAVEDAKDILANW